MTSNVVLAIVVIAASYLLGSIPFGYLLTRKTGGGDIRTQGSGNIGATNVLRTQGKALGAVTLVLDFAKAALPVWITSVMGFPPWVSSAAGAAAVLGHCFPVYLGFRGGKGIASGLGAFVFIAPLPTGIALLVFMAEVLTFRFVSLGSILASFTFSVLIIAFHLRYGWYDLPSALIGAAIGLLLVSRHHSNIFNLLKGTESRVWGKGSTS